MSGDGPDFANDPGNVVPFPVAKSPPVLNSVVFAALGSDGQVSVSFYGEDNDSLAFLVKILAKELGKRIKDGE